MKISGKGKKNNILNIIDNLKDLKYILWIIQNRIQATEICKDLLFDKVEQIEKEVLEFIDKGDKKSKDKIRFLKSEKFFYQSMIVDFDIFINSIKKY